MSNQCASDAAIDVLTLWLLLMVPKSTSQQHFQRKSCNADPYEDASRSTWETVLDNDACNDEIGEGSNKRY